MVLVTYPRKIRYTKNQVWKTIQIMRRKNHFNCKYSYMKTLVRILLIFSRDYRICLLLLAFEDMVKKEWKTNISFKKIQIGKQYLPIFEKDDTSTDDSNMLYLPTRLLKMLSTEISLLNKMLNALSLIWTFVITNAS